MEGFFRGIIYFILFFVLVSSQSCLCEFSQTCLFVKPSRNHIYLWCSKVEIMTISFLSFVVGKPVAPNYPQGKLCIHPKKITNAHIPPIGKISADTYLKNNWMPLMIRENLHGCDYYRSLQTTCVFIGRSSSSQ